MERITDLAPDISDAIFEKASSPSILQDRHLRVGISYCRTDPMNEKRASALALWLSQQGFKVAIDLFYVGLTYTGLLDRIFNSDQVRMI